MVTLEDLPWASKNTIRLLPLLRELFSPVDYNTTVLNIYTFMLFSGTNAIPNATDVK